MINQAFMLLYEKYSSFIGCIFNVCNIKGSNTNLKLYFSMTRHNIFYIHVKAGASSLLLVSNILTKLHIWLLIGQKCEIQSI